MNKNNFTFMQRIRNKIKIKGDNNIIELEDNSNTNITGNTIFIKGNNCILKIVKGVELKILI